MAIFVSFCKFTCRFTRSHCGLILVQCMQDYHLITPQNFKLSTTEYFGRWSRQALNPWEHFACGLWVNDFLSSPIIFHLFVCQSRSSIKSQGFVDFGSAMNALESQRCGSRMQVAVNHLVYFHTMF